MRSIRSDSGLGGRDQSRPVSPLIRRSFTHRSTPLTASIAPVTASAGSPSRGNRAYPCDSSADAPGRTMYAFMSPSIQMK